MEHGDEILDLELMDRIDLHDPTAVCALRGLLRVLAGHLISAATWAFPHAGRMKEYHILDREVCRPLCPRLRPLDSTVRAFK